MNRAILEEARAALRAGPLPLTELHARLARAGSGWSKAQHCLFFLAFAEFSVEGNGNRILVRAGEQAPEDRLLAEIVKAVESLGGKPAPAREIRKRLPPDVVTTDEQVRALARTSTRLEVFGPGMIRLRKS